MITEYFVDYKLHNANGGWAFKTTKHTDDFDEATREYHSLLSTYIKKEPYDHVCVVLSDSYGNSIMNEWWHKKEVEAPETVEE